MAVDWASSLHDIEVDVVAELNEPLPIDSEVADTALSLSELEHLREPQTMLNEAFRIPNPGGTTVLQVPWQWWIHEVSYDHFRYTPCGLRYVLEKAGFMEVHVEPQAGFFTMGILKFSCFTLRIIRGPKPLRNLIQLGVLPLWLLGQVLAPWLDKLDRNWALEEGGYFVTAKKP